MTNFTPRFSLSLFLFAATIAGCRADSFVGAFTFDNDLEIQTFTLPALSDVVIRTFGYGGGVNGASTTIAAGGFDPYLSVFAGTGSSATLFAVNDDGACPPLTADPSSGFCLDSYLSLAALPAGSYTVVLSQYENLPLFLTLGDGFTRDSQPNYTSTDLTGLPGSFWALPAHQRSGNWSHDITVSPLTAVPEPSVLSALVVGMLALGCSRNRIRLK